MYKGKLVCVAVPLCMGVPLCVGVPVVGVLILGKGEGEGVESGVVVEKIEL